MSGQFGVCLKSGSRILNELVLINYSDKPETNMFYYSNRENLTFSVC